MKQTILILLITATGLNLFGQRNLLEEDVTKIDFHKSKEGQNMANYTHWFLAYGMFVSPSEGEGADLKYGSSDAFSVGIRYKRKIANFFAIGVESWYSAEDFDIKQNDKKLVVNQVIHKKEDFRYNNLNGSFYMRFNFGKRGNIIGKYIDLGGYGAWAFNIRHTYTDKAISVNPYNGADVIKTVDKKLNYMNFYNYGFVARIGINRYSIYGTYRLSDLFVKDFKENIADVELSRIQVGMQIGLHK